MGTQRVDRRRNHSTGDPMVMPVRTSRDKQQNRDKQPVLDQVDWLLSLSPIRTPYVVGGYGDKQTWQLHPLKARTWDKQSGQGHPPPPPADHRLRSQRNRAGSQPPSSRTGWLRVTKSALEETPCQCGMGRREAANTACQPRPTTPTPTRQFAQTAREAIAAPMCAARMIRKGGLCVGRRKNG
jgi:hypothetical protein